MKKNRYALSVVKGALELRCGTRKHALLLKLDSVSTELNPRVLVTYSGLHFLMLAINT